MGVRDSLVEDKNFFMASSTLIEYNENSNLQFAALRAIAKMAKYSASNGSFSADSVGKLLETALAIEPKISEKENIGWNLNLYYLQAVEGALVVFDSLSKSKQEGIFKEVSTLYVKLLKSHSFSRS